MNSAQPSQTEASTIWRTPDELWQRIAPVLVIDKPRKKLGRPRVNDRRIFDGLIYLEKHGWAVVRPAVRI